MRGHSLFPALLLACLASQLLLHAQSDTTPLVPPPHALLQIEARTSEQMNVADRQLLTDSKARIESATNASGYDLHDASWTYQQSICPLFPHSMLLRYDADSGFGRASRFVVVLDRASGEVQVVSALRAGNTPFRSSYQNDNTYAIFNQLLARERLQINSAALQTDNQWVKLALCYAELSGDHPTTLLTDTLYGEAFDRNVNVPTRRMGSGGSMVLEFCDVNDPQATMQWRLRFDAHGRLVAVERERRPLNSTLRRLKTNTALFPATQVK